ncbi:21873_t:CDS:2, partial [Cetraspora pellucida]
RSQTGKADTIRAATFETTLQSDRLNKPNQNHLKTQETHETMPRSNMIDTPKNLHTIMLQA